MTGTVDDLTTQAAAVKDWIGRLGGGFMRSREVAAASREAGYHGWQFYFAGRCGVLGDVDADVVSAAVVFFPPDFVRQAWEAGRQVEPRPAAVARYAAAAHAWGRRQLADVDGMDRLAVLLGKVVRQLPVLAAPLAAGWRRVPLPDDPPARVTQFAHVLREHRGAMHIVACVAAGMAPLHAILAGPGGVEGARYFGWPPPYPTVDPALRAARAGVEEHTDQLAGPIWGVLDSVEAAECRHLLQVTAERLDSK